MVVTHRTVVTFSDLSFLIFKVIYKSLHLHSRKEGSILTVYVDKLELNRVLLLIVYWFLCVYGYFKDFHKGRHFLFYLLRLKTDPRLRNGLNLFFVTLRHKLMKSANVFSR